MEEQYGFGALPSPPDIRDYHLAAQVINIAALPETFINRKTKIKYQGSQQTCVAHALSSLVEFHNGTNETFSTEFIYGCRTDKDYLGEGMYLRDGLKILQNYGDVFLQDLPGNSSVPVARKNVFTNFDILKEKAYPNRISTYYKIYTIEELKYSLYNNGPVPASMRWFNGAKLDSQGNYNYITSKQFTGHAVLIVGWTKDSFICQNSWSERSGDKGYFYIPFKKLNEVFFELYGVTDDIVTVKKPSKPVDVLSPVINAALQLVKIFQKYKK